ncbi:MULTISPECIES: GNAT family N-acetyltransferase [Bacillus cereus group]|uniref:GNAT family N-acetyltransferase n=1 Tax=Bacillus cereus TaxID=1396 RepID=A0A9W7QJR7_BACCE|nr:GNAT family N-acetyltransferase [Bacillus cereus]KAB2400115.1 GNAT family N-acetyltransferase [Bacillus cereus]KAB2410458.1 GNAT family N-acetyltransferase [Bacillus cereus]KAB2427748.1 GNAT family N-acetyltransferase [Bacillus cereus]
MTSFFKQNVLLEVDNINEMELALTAFNSKRALSLVDKNLKVKKVGDCTILIDSKSPSSIYYNRIKGFGINDIDKIDEILDIYDSEQITPCFDMIPNNINIEVAQILMNKGFYCAEQLLFLEIEPHFDNYENGEIELVKVTGENVVEFLRLIALSNEMELEKELVKRKAEYFFQPNFQNYIAYIGEEAIGMGSLFIRGEKGYIANDFTFPSHRGKGVQKALLHHRIQAAKEMGLTKIYTDVEFGSASHNNMLKIGFQAIFLNSFWMKAE